MRKRPLLSINVENEETKIPHDQDEDQDQDQEGGSMPNGVNASHGNGFYTNDTKISVGVGDDSDRSEYIPCLTSSEEKKDGVYIAANFLSYTVFVPKKAHQSTVEKKEAPKDYSFEKQKCQSKKESTPRRMERKTLLTNVNMYAIPGEITYLMGPSGAGKSTLLDLLAGRTKQGAISGEILFNGKSRNKTFWSKVAYVQQDDLHLPILTVQETLAFAAELRMNKNSSQQEREERIRMIVNLLGLEHCMNSVVGNAELRGISGGQLKRLSIAVEIIHMPTIIFLDEPTSGLDSVIAHEVMSFVHRIAKTNNSTVVATIHQPSPDTWALAESCVFLAQGHLCYCGPAGEKVIDYFKNYLGFNDEGFANPADFVLSCISPNNILLWKDIKKTRNENFTVGDKVNNDQVSKNTNLQEDKETNGGLLQNKDSIIALPSPESHGYLPHQFASFFLMSNYYVNMILPSSTPSTSPSSSSELNENKKLDTIKDKSITTKALYKYNKPFEDCSFEKEDYIQVNNPPFSLPFWKQTQILLKRGILTQKRQTAFLRAQIVKNLIVGCISGIIFWQQGTAAEINEQPFNVASLLFFAMLYTILTNLQAIPQLYFMKVLYIRERSAFVYSTAAYWAANCILYIPFNLICHTIFINVAYWMCGLEKSKYNYVFWASALNNIVSFYLAQFIAASAGTAQVALALFPVSFLFMTSFTGFTIPLPQIPLGWKWATYISYPRWTFEGLIMNEFGCCDLSNTMDKYYGNSQYDKNLTFLVLFLFLVVFNYGVYWGLSPSKVKLVYEHPPEIDMTMKHTKIFNTQKDSSEEKDNINANETIPFSNEDHSTDIIQANQDEEEDEEMLSNKRPLLQSIDEEISLQRTSSSYLRTMFQAGEKIKFSDVLFMLSNMDGHTEGAIDSNGIVYPPSSLYAGLNQEVTGFMPDHRHNKHMFIDPYNHHQSIYCSSQSTSLGENTLANGPMDSDARYFNVDYYALRSSHIKKSTGIRLSFRNLHYSVGGRNMETGKKILNRISGRVEPGQMCALMGGSGAGKSTLLDILAGRKTSGFIRGDIRFNGKKVLTNLHRRCAYVTQDNIHIGVFTVEETLTWAAKLRMNESQTDEERKERVKDVLLMLGLDNVKNVLVGDAFTKGISGGQARRLSIGVEIINLPDLIFLDEPTTGLDSNISYEVMAAVRNLANQNRTVVCTIHQPSHDVFALFDTLLILSRGEHVYFGSTTECIKYFTSDLLSYDYVRDTNPADFVMLCTGDTNKTKTLASINEMQVKGIIETNKVGLKTQQDMALLRLKDNNNPGALLENSNQNKQERYGRENFMTDRENRKQIIKERYDKIRSKFLSLFRHRQESKEMNRENLGNGYQQLTNEAYIEEEKWDTTVNVPRNNTKGDILSESKKKEIIDRDYRIQINTSLNSFLNTDDNGYGSANDDGTLTRTAKQLSDLFQQSDLYLRLIESLDEAQLIRDRKIDDDEEYKLLHQNFLKLCEMDPLQDSIYNSKSAGLSSLLLSGSSQNYQQELACKQSKAQAQYLKQKFQLYPRELGKLTWLLSSRQLQKVRRRPRLAIVGIIRHIFVALFYGSLYFQMAPNAIQSRLSLLFFAIMFVMLGNQQCIPSIFDDRLIYYREKGAHIYSYFSYWLTCANIYLPQIALNTFLYSAIVYPLSGLHPCWEAFWFFYLSIALSSMNALFFCQFLAIALPSAQTTVAIFPAALFLFIAFAGYIVRIPTLPTWLSSWATDVSFARWAFQGLVINEFDGNEEIDYSNLPEVYYSKYPSYEFLSDLGFQGYSKWYSIPVLLLNMVILRLFTFLVLKHISHEKR